VLLQFLIEAIVMSALGGVLGVLIGLGGSAAICAALKLPFVFQPGIVVIAVGFAAIVGVAFGYFPARRAAPRSDRGAEARIEGRVAPARLRAALRTDR
jgi:ABC-type antimicrobial peptide transport system permease subunit